MEQVTVFFTTISYEGHDYRAHGAIDEHRHLDTWTISDLESPSLVGRIYRAKVVDLVPSMHCAFVLLDKQTKAYLPFSSCDHPLRSDEELLVQVETDAIKTKFAVVTQLYELKSEHCGLTYGSGVHGVSKKLSKKEREDWKAFLEEYDDSTGHLLLRTNVAGCSKEDIRQEVDGLMSDAADLAHRGAHATCFSLLYEPPSDIIPSMRRYMALYGDSLSDGNFRVVTDEKGIYEELTEACANGAVDLPAEMLSLYMDTSYPLFKLYSLSSQLEELLQKTVWLDSGANILIESMETLTAIDVNSAKKQGKKKRSDEVFALNLEAGKEIARQLRLRNISGMILIDFVNMEAESDQEALLNAMKSYVKQDERKVNVLDITKLGLMELTREKVSKSLKQTVKKS